MKEAEALSKMVSPGMKRPNAYRQGIIQIHVTQVCDRACVNCTQLSQIRQPKRFISLENFEKAVVSLVDHFGVVGIFGGNPCIAKGTRVYTTGGALPIEDLEGKVFHVRNIHGEIHQATCWHAGKQQLYEIRLRGGHRYFATANHEWPAIDLRHGVNSKRKGFPNYSPGLHAHNLGKVKTTDLLPGMRLPISSADSLEFGSVGDYEDGFLAGWILGDGWIAKKQQAVVRYRKNGSVDKRFSESGRVRHVGMIVNEEDRVSGIADRLLETVKRIGSDATWRAVKQCHEISVRTSGMDDWLTQFGVIGKSDGLPLSTWTTASERFRCGLIDGLFSADGNVEVSSKRGFVRIRLTTSHEKMADDVSALLGFYGIKTQIDKRTRPGSFPNGKDYGREYTSYTLSISNTASVNRFSRLFPLTHKQKNERLQLSSNGHKADVESTNIEILSVTPTDRHEDVWDISVNDDTHTFQLAHCVTGNCLHPKFPALCEILEKHIPKERRGLWCNNPLTHGKLMRRVFNPSVSNLNVHMDKWAYKAFKQDWPESRPVGLESDSRHASGFVAMQDVIDDPEVIWEKISTCDINQFWSAMICEFRGEARGYFCEIAGAQAMYHQTEPDYPDLGVPIEEGWWRKTMTDFAAQARYHCFACGFPMRAEGALATHPESIEQVSKTHAEGYVPKQSNRKVEEVQTLVQLGVPLGNVTRYVQNAEK